MSPSHSNRSSASTSAGKYNSTTVAYVVSALPIAACFFCGGSGPETVAEAYLNDEVRYTSKPVTVTGTLTLNDTDYDQLMYILNDAKISFK